LEEPENRVNHSEINFALVVDHQLDDHVIEVLRGLQIGQHFFELDLLSSVEFGPSVDFEVIGQQLPETEDVLSESGSTCGFPSKVIR
jgi:hypothetical protein